MNLLLRQLMNRGVMQHRCTATADKELAITTCGYFPGRAVFDMGAGTHPGPYWVVHAEDIEALTKEGYRAIFVNN